QLSAKLMAQLDWCRHQFWSLPDGESKHQALIPSSLLISIFPLYPYRIHTLGNIARLPAQRLDNNAGVGVKLRVFLDISDVPDSGAHFIEIIKLRVRGDLASDNNQIAFCQSFARNTALGIPGQTRVKDAIRNRIANFIRMTFGNRFRREDITSRHR